MNYSQHKAFYSKLYKVHLFIPLCGGLLWEPCAFGIDVQFFCRCPRLWQRKQVRVWGCRKFGCVLKTACPCEKLFLVRNQLTRVSSRWSLSIFWSNSNKICRVLGESVLALCKDVSGESVVKELSDCTSFRSCLSFGISDHWIDGVEVILCLSVVFFKSVSVGFSSIVLKICSGFV